MKSTSASLVVLAGTIVLAASAFAQDNAQVLLGITGALIAMTGLMGWIREWGPPL